MIKCQQSSLNERVKTILWTFTTIFGKCQHTMVIVNILLLLFKNAKVLSDRNYVPWVEHYIIESLWQSIKYKDIKFTSNKKNQTTVRRPLNYNDSIHEKCENI